MMEYITRARCSQRVDWRRREDAYRVFDVLSLFVMIICISFSNMASIVIAPAVFALLALLYSPFSLIPGGMKIAGCLIRLAFAGQAFQITAQQKAVIQGDWALVFLISWAYLLAPIMSAVLYIVAIILSSPVASARFILNGEFIRGEGRERSLAAIWFASSLGANLTLSGFLLGIARDLNGEQGLVTMKICALIGLITGILCIILATIVPKALIKHVEMFTYYNTFMESREEEQADELTITSAPIITLETIKKVQYFFKLSGSYFASINKDLLIKSMDYTRCSSNKRRTEGSNNPLFNRRKSLQVLIQPNTKPAEGREGRKRSQSVGLTSELNLEPLFPNKKEKEVINENDGNCYVCCEKEPNAIMMNCGHGGVCYRCAIIQVKTKAECIECRGSVEVIAYIDKESGLKDVYRSRGFSKVIKTLNAYCRNFVIPVNTIRNKYIIHPFIDALESYFCNILDPIIAKAHSQAK